MGAMGVVVLGLSHHTSPVEMRERFAIAEGALPEALEQLNAKEGIDEAVILSTCNRVELYVASSLSVRKTGDLLEQFLLDYHGSEGSIQNTVYTIGEPQSIEHLFKVAAGLDSMVLGETEILGQLKRAYQLAHKQKQTGSRLNKAFQRAFNVAKQLRSHTQIQRGSISVGSVAVELAEKIFDSLHDRQVMVLGAGETSERTARALLSRGAKSILVSNRSYDRAEHLASELGGTAIHFEDWDSHFDRVDIVISSTAAPHYVLDSAKLNHLMPLRQNRPLLLIDIAVPRDIAPEVNFLENVFIYNIDDLQAIADSYLKQRQEEVARCETVIREKAAGLLPDARPPSFSEQSQWALGNG